MDFLELSKSRYSVLHYQNKPIPDELLNKIVEARSEEHTSELQSLL